MRASVCLSVCMLVTTLSPAKADEPISMSFWRQTCVGPSNRVLDVGPDPQRIGRLVPGTPWTMYASSIRARRT